MRGSKNITGQVITSLIGGLFMAGSAFAVPVTFNLRDTTAFADIEDGSVVRDGITATLTPLVAGNLGVLNQTASAFGINAANIVGVGDDDADELDSDEGAESISITFDVDVLWNSFVVSSFGTGEQGLVKIASFGPAAFASTGMHSVSADNLVLAGQSVILGHVAGTGFSFDSFTVDRWFRSTETNPSPTNGVPDAGATVALLGLSLSGLGFFARHRS